MANKPSISLGFQIAPDLSAGKFPEKKSCLGEKTNGKLKSQDGSLTQFTDQLFSV